MSTDARWPRLMLGVHPVLDWVEDSYSKELLLEMAEAVRKNPHPIQTRSAAGALGVWDSPIESLLRSLAASPAALKALNHRRPTPPARVVALNRAVHFHVVFELLPDGRGRATDAWHKVATAWNVSDGHVKDDVAQFRVDDPRTYRADDAKRLAEQIIALAGANTGKSRIEVLGDFSQDMWDRAEPYRSAK